MLDSPRSIRGRTTARRAAAAAVVPVLPVVAGLRLNSERMSKPWPSTGTVNAVAAKRPLRRAHIDREILAICSLGWALGAAMGTYMVAGPLTTVIAPPMPRPPCCLNRLSAAVEVITLSVHDAFAEVYTCKLRQYRDGKHGGARYEPSQIMKPIRKAVFPVAGLEPGSLPATKAVPRCCRWSTGR